MLHTAVWFSAQEGPSLHIEIEHCRACDSQLVSLQRQLETPAVGCYTSLPLLMLPPWVLTWRQTNIVLGHLSHRVGDSIHRERRLVLSAECSYCPVTRKHHVGQDPSLWVSPVLKCLFMILNTHKASLLFRASAWLLAETMGSCCNLGVII